MCCLKYIHTKNNIEQEGKHSLYSQQTQNIKIK